MSSEKNQIPDLASVLRTLAGLSQYQHGGHQPQNQPSQQQDTTSQRPPQQMRQAPPKTYTPPPVKVVDPATITDWSSGLRCVMKTVSNHGHVLQEVRKMIKVQNEHEEQWWKGREALIERQKARKEGQRKLDEVLKAVGGATGTGASNTSPEELARELEIFDMKVYKAQTQMVKEMDGKLRNLGVPFFGMESELVRVDGKDGMIDKTELVELQRRMLSILEDLCGD